MANSIRFNRIPEMQAKIPLIRSQLVRAGAFTVQGYAQQGAPVDTGALKNSIYTVTENSSGYGGARPAVAKGAYLFPEAPQQAPGHAMVVVGVSYGIFPELGTIHMPAQLYMTPAAIRAEPAYINAWSKFEEMLAA